MNNCGNVSRQTHYTQNYTETGRLGEGGFGIVVKARHNLDQQEYAIKKVPLTGTRSKRDKYKREVKALAVLKHKNIVRYYTAWIQDVSDPEDFIREGIIDAGSETSSYGSNFGSSTGEDTVSMIIFIQMELCSSNLRTWLDDRNKEKSSLSAEDIRQSMPMMREILEGLEFLHSMNLVHRDLKPENIFLQNGQIKIGDFGLAKELRDDEHTSNSSSAGTSRLYAVGTAPYAAPEMSGGTLNPTSKSDIYSLGVIFFETCICIHTKMELYKVLTEFKEREFSAPVTWSKQAETIKSMLTGLPDKRPSAKELLSGPLFTDAQVVCGPKEAEPNSPVSSSLADSEANLTNPIGALKELAEKRNLGNPDYIISDTGLSANMLEFSCKVIVGKDSFESPQKYRAKKDAKKAAALLAYCHLKSVERSTAETTKSKLTGLPDKRPSAKEPLSEPLFTDAQAETTKSNITGLLDKRPSAKEPLSEPLLTDAQEKTTKSKLTCLPDYRTSLTWLSGPLFPDAKEKTTKGKLTGLPDERPSAKEPLSEPLLADAKEKTTKSKLTCLPDYRTSLTWLSEPLLTDAQAEIIKTKSKLPPLPDWMHSLKYPFLEPLFADAKEKTTKSKLTCLPDYRTSLTWTLSGPLLTDAQVVCGPKEAEPNSPVSSSLAGGAARGRTLEKDPVSAFMEYAQAKGQTADIVVLRQSGPPHQPEFEMAAQLGERQFRSITSNKKRTGRKLAAIEALKDLKIKTT